MVNAITLYRLAAAPLLVALIFFDQLNVFRWLLAISFFTDSIDGYLARRFKVSSAFGAKLDSIGDDLTVLAGIVGMIFFKPGFLWENVSWIAVVLILFILQVSLSFLRYRKMTSFHTYGAKIAAVFQGVFLILLFFLPGPVMWLFYSAVIITSLELIEEMIIVMILPEWQTDIKGLYWVLKQKKMVDKKQTIG